MANIRRSNFTSLLISLAVGAGITACGSESKPRYQPVNKSSDADNGSNDANAEAQESGDETSFDELATPPQEYYDALFTESLLNLDGSLGLLGADQVLYTNFNGATVTKGYNRGESFIPCKKTSVIDAPNLSPADISEITTMVQAFYDKTAAKLVVTSEKPASGDYTTINVGGSYSDLGCVGRGVLGIAPFDKGNANKNDIGFAFTNGVNSNRIIAETIAHEAGHSFGLDHVTSRQDLMFASSTNEITGFLVSRVSGSGKVQDEPAILRNVLGELPAGSTTGADPSLPTTPVSSTPVANNGTSSNGTGGAIAGLPTNIGNIGSIANIPGIANLPANLGNLPGLSQIGNIGSLIPGLSQAGALDIGSLLNQAVGTLPIGAASAGLPEFDKILAAIGLSAQAGANQQPAQGAGGIVGNISSLAGGILGNANLGGLGNLASLAGLGSVGSLGNLQGVIDGLVGGSLGNIGGAANPNIQAGLPDLSQLLGIVGQGTTPADLINNLVGSSQVINANFTGASQDALLSLVKVAYSQAFNQLGK